MYHYVYKTVNPISKKFYIGKHSTKLLNDEYQGSGVWIKKCRKSNTHLITGIIKFCKNEDQACKLEEKLIKKYFNNTLNMNYKLASAGMKSEDILGLKNPFYGKKHTEETRKIISEKRPDVSGVKNPMYGKNHSKETIEIIKKKLKGKNKGVPKTEEQKKKMSLARKKFWEKVKKEGRILKMGRGVPKSEEHKKNLSIATKLIHLKRKGRVA